MATVEGVEYPEDLFYDVENQLWYAPLPDGALRVGYMPWAATMMGEILVFTPKRLGRDFEKNRSFATVEGGKWTGAVCAAFDGVVVAANPLLERAPERIVDDPFGEGWMLVVRPARDDWREALVTGPAIGPTLEAWIA